MRISIPKGTDLFGTLQKQNIHLSAFCGGKEKCGKCKVRIVSMMTDEGVGQGADFPVTEVERRLLTESELAAGVRLACCHKCCEADVMVEVTDESAGFAILGSEKEQYETGRSEDGVGIAVDIGTTTLAMAVIDLRDGRCLSETKVMNPQRVYGADVINRIQACNDHGVAVLQQMVLREVEQVVYQVLSTGQTIRRMVVCGNSTMEHIFLGIEPRKISEYPYTCEFEETQVVDSRQLFGQTALDEPVIGEDVSAQNVSAQEVLEQPGSGDSFPVIVLPNIAAFVGGDIVAGLIGTEMDIQDKQLLIDLGTNGEMALSHGGKIYTTSTAAGPAFEGGNMLCGVASIPGAICRIQMDGDEVQYETIGGRPMGDVVSYDHAGHSLVRPIGICGSGYIEGISEILTQGLMDETGYMEQDVEIEGDICIVPADIRNFQLAKSAVRSGINILCRRAGVTFEEIEEVYISGGFGKASNLAALANLKIIPKEFVVKTRLLGNTALEGAIRVLLDNDMDRLSAVKAKSCNVDLASDPRFNDEYMDNMWF